MRETDNSCLEKKNLSSVTKMETNPYKLQDTSYNFMSHYGKEPVGTPHFPFKSLFLKFLTVFKLDVSVFFFYK